MQNGISKKQGYAVFAFFKVLVFQDLGSHTLELRHCLSYGCTDVSRVANYIFLSLYGDEIALHILVEAYRCGDMVRIIEQHDIEFQQVAHQI